MTDIYAKQTQTHYPRLFFIVFLTFFCGFFAVFCRFFSAFLSVFPRGVIGFASVFCAFRSVLFALGRVFDEDLAYRSGLICALLAVYIYGALRRIILNGYALLVKLHGAPAPLALITAVNSKANSAAAFTLRIYLLNT